MPTRAPRKIVPAQRAYQLLLRDLRRLISEGRQRAEAAAGRELVVTYHAVGKRILAAKLSDQAGYANAVLQRLANELGLSQRLLQRAVAFAKLYPTLTKTQRRLRWAHYRELVGIKDARVRTFYEGQALQQSWTRDKLVEAIRNQRHLEFLPSATPVHVLEPAGPPKAGSGSSSKKKQVIPVIARPAGAHYVYKAQVEKVIDGETLMVMVDLGFHLYKRQRVRLAAIDAPAASSAQGKQAKAFVSEALSTAEFIILKTVSIDHHGRYTAHVFYQPQSRDEALVYTEGQHLNQQLAQSGLVAVV